MQTIPHYYLTVNCRVDKLMQLRAQLNEALAARDGGKLSVNDFVVKASALVRLPPVCYAEAVWQSMDSQQACNKHTLQMRACPLQLHHSSCLTNCPWLCKSCTPHRRWPCPCPVRQGQQHKLSAVSNISVACSSRAGELLFTSRQRCQASSAAD